jgi:hypothetical protein
MKCKILLFNPSSVVEKNKRNIKNIMQDPMVQLPLGLKEYIKNITNAMQDPINQSPYV